MFRSVWLNGVFVVLVSAIAGCAGEEASAPAPAPPPAVEDRLVVYTVNYPLAYFAERIAGELADVSFPAPSDVDPAYWSPDAETVIEYQQADLVVLNGAGYAVWVSNAALPGSRLVDTTAAVSDRLVTIENAVTHSHGPEAEHSHASTAITTWLDLELAIEQARAIYERLVELRPDDEAQLSERFGALEADLLALDAGLAAVAGRLGGQPVLFSHPVYQYLERRYQLNGYSVHWEPGEVPGDSQWRAFSSVLAAHPAAVMIWEGEPTAETVSRLSELGVESIVFEPGGNALAEGDWLAAMRRGIEALESVAN